MPEVRLASIAERLNPSHARELMVGKRKPQVRQFFQLLLLREGIDADSIAKKAAELVMANYKRGCGHAHNCSNCGNHSIPPTGTG